MPHTTVITQDEYDQEINRCLTFEEINQYIVTKKMVFGGIIHRDLKGVCIDQVKVVPNTKGCKPLLKTQCKTPPKSGCKTPPKECIPIPKKECKTVKKEEQREKVERRPSFDKIVKDDKVEKDDKAVRDMKEIKSALKDDEREHIRKAIKYENKLNDDDLPPKKEEKVRRKLEKELDIIEEEEGEEEKIEKDIKLLKYEDRKKEERPTFERPTFEKVEPMKSLDNYKYDQPITFEDDKVPPIPYPTSNLKEYIPEPPKSREMLRRDEKELMMLEKKERVLDKVEKELRLEGVDKKLLQDIANAKEKTLKKEVKVEKEIEGILREELEEEKMKKRQLERKLEEKNIFKMPTLPPVQMSKIKTLTKQDRDVKDVKDIRDVKDIDVAEEELSELLQINPQEFKKDVEKLDKNDKKKFVDELEKDINKVLKQQVVYDEKISKNMREFLERNDKPKLDHAMVYINKSNKNNEILTNVAEMLKML